MKFLLIFALFFYSAWAQSFYCAQQWACSQAEPTKDGVDFWLFNNKPYPITQTLIVKARNLRSQDGKRNHYEKTFVLKGFEKRLALSLSKVQVNQDYWFQDNFEWTPGDMYAKHNDDVRYLKPFSPGRYYPIVQGFGGGYSHRGPSQYAVDFAMPEGTPVYAARSGVVIDLAEHNWRGGASRRYAKYANFVVILHDDGTTGEYYHLRQQGVVVARDQKVQAGELIGYSGNTGFSSLPHLHFAVYRAKSHGQYQSVPFRFAD